MAISESDWKVAARDSLILERVLRSRAVDVKNGAVSARNTPRQPEQIAAPPIVEIGNGRRD